MIAALSAALAHSAWQGVACAAVAELVLRSTDRPEVRHRWAVGLLAAQLASFGATFATSWGPSHDPTGTLPSPPAWVVAWAVAAWSVGASLSGARLGLELLGVGWLRSRSLPAPPAWVERWSALAARVWAAGADLPATELRLIRAGSTPMVAGWWRPVVLVPASLLVDLPSAQLEALLVHELAHLARRDHLWAALQAVAEVVLFHHPATWWLSSVARRERELCCDALARRTVEPEVYARALFALETRRVPRPALAANGGELMERIRFVLGHPRAPHRVRALPLAVAILGLGWVSAAATAGNVHAPPAAATWVPREEPEPPWTGSDRAVRVPEQPAAPPRLEGVTDALGAPPPPPPADAPEVPEPPPAPDAPAPPDAPEAAEAPPEPPEPPLAPEAPVAPEPLAPEERVALRAALDEQLRALEARQRALQESLRARLAAVDEASRAARAAEEAAREHRHPRTAPPASEE